MLIGGMEIITLDVIIGAICMGIFIATVFSYFIKTVHGGFIRMLLSSGALTPENSKSLSEVEYDSNYLIKISLRKPGSLNRVLRTVTDEEGIVKYYIPEELHFRANSIYNKKGASAITLILTFIALILIMLAASYLLPLLISFMSDLLGSGGNAQR